MNIKVMQVFFNSAALPFKDQERQVHYPITSGSFLGASNTVEIRFYLDQIGQDITWVVNGKLPNGKIGHTLLTRSADTDDTGEYYYSFMLNAFYTQYKGDLYLSLAGYNGDKVLFEEIDDTDTYTINGTPTIQTTGVIKLNIAYSTGILDGDIGEEIDLDTILSELANKLDISGGIVVVNYANPTTSIDTNSYSDLQVFFNKYDNKFYINNAGTIELYANPLENDIGIIVKDSISDGVTTLSESELNEALKKFCILLVSPASGVTTTYLKNNRSATNVLYFFEVAPRFATDCGATQITQKGLSVNKTSGVINVYDNGVILYSKVQADNTFVSKAGSNTISADNTYTGDNVYDVLPQSNEDREYTSGREFTDKDYVDEGLGTKANKTTKVNGHALSGDVTISKGDIGLGNVDNVQQVPLSQKGQANGVATLDENAKVPTNQLPDSILSNMQRLGTLNIINSDDTLEHYILDTDGFIAINGIFKQELGLTTTSSITLNGITYTGGSGNLITFSDFIARVKELGISSDKVKELLSTFLIVGNIVTESGNRSHNIIDKDLVQGTLSSGYHVYNSTTGDWLIIDGFSGYGSILWLSFSKVDNTDAVQSVNGKTGAVVLDNEDIGLGNVDNVKQYPYSSGVALEADKLSKTEAEEIYQAKILHADLSNISGGLVADGGSWVLDTEVTPNIYRYTSGDLYSILGLVNTDDLAEIVGIDSVTREAIGQFGIYLENVTTTSGETYAYICSTFLPTENLNLTVVVTKQYASGGAVSGVITESDIGNGLKIEDSKVQIDFGSVAYGQNKPVSGSAVKGALDSGYVKEQTFSLSTTLEDISNSYHASIFTALFHFSPADNVKGVFVIGTTFNNSLFDVEIEQVGSATRYVVTGVSKTTTLGDIMVAANQSDYLTGADCYTKTQSDNKYLYIHKCDFSTETLASFVGSNNAYYVLQDTSANHYGIWVIGTTNVSSSLCSFQLINTVNSLRSIGSNVAKTTTLSQAINNYRQDYSTTRLFRHTITFSAPPALKEWTTDNTGATTYSEPTLTNVSRQFSIITNKSTAITSFNDIGLMISSPQTYGNIICYGSLVINIGSEYKIDYFRKTINGFLISCNSIDNAGNTITKAVAVFDTNTITITNDTVEEL